MIGQNPRLFWKRYVVAMAILIMLLVGGHAVHIRSLQAGATDAETIDLSGRQRMLSQRIAALLETLMHSDQGPAYTASLVASLRLFEQSHQALLDRSAAFPTAAAVYAVGDSKGLDAQVRSFLQIARSALAMRADDPALPRQIARLEAMAFEPLLANLDEAVKSFAADSRARHDRLEWLQTIALFCALGLLLLEGVFIFWPAQQNINRALDRAESRTRDLQARNQELRTLSGRLEHSAHHDQLTGLANRKKLHHDLEARLARGGEGTIRTCVMHIDLDRFKEINDALGHPVGDAVLRRAAEAMKAKTRKGDLVSRVGGDEFIIVSDFDARNTPEAQAQRMAEGLIARIREPMLIEANTCTVGASIGYVFAEKGELDCDRLIGDADIALYEAKRAGKGVAVPFKPAMRSNVERRHALIQDLERALAANEFVPFLQPKVSLTDGHLVGFEVLSRWEHPTRGILPPADFIDLAEETGLIDSIDREAAFGGLDALVRIRASGWDLPTLAVNASGSSLRSPEYAADLRMALAMRGLKPSDLRIEVVENTLISDAGDKAIDTLRQLAEIGFRIDIDDFGTGYASLSMLSRFDLSGLKIDRELIRDLDARRPQQVIEAIVGLARGLSLEVIVEGVETPQQFSRLSALGCDTAQGFGVARPMSVKDTLSWLEEFGARTRISDGKALASAQSGIRRGGSTG